MSFNYETAKAHLTETEKNRIVAIYLNMKNTGAAEIDWKQATEDFGSTSIESMKVSLNNSLKKLKKLKEAGDGGESTPTPASSSKKRKGAAADPQSTPSGKKRGRKPKQVATPATEDDEKTAEVKNEDVNDKVDEEDGPMAF